MDVDRNALARIKDLLKSHHRGMNVTEISREMGMNRQSAAKYLEMMVMSGHVDVRAYGPSKVYFLSPRLPVSAMLSLSNNFILILDRNLNIINVNDRFLEFTGTSREDLIYKTIGKFAFPLEFEPPILPNITEALAGKEASLEALYRKDNKGIFFSIKFIPMVLDDGEKGITIIFEDITLRKQAEMNLERIVKERTAELEVANKALAANEEKYRRLVESVSDGVWEMDKDFRFTYMSPRIIDMIGFEPEYAIGKTPYDLMPPDEARRVKKIAGPVGQAHMPLLFLECKLLHKNGEHVFVEINGSPFFDAKGNFGGLRGVTRNVSHRLKK
jgi:PAS domain S-box-containing protein